MTIATFQDLVDLKGQTIGTSSWHEVRQEDIDRFADVTHDHQFIHVDPAKAADTPLGGTIAHGFLTLSLLPHLTASANFQLAGIKMGMNYGFNRIRFLNPVRAGKRIRAIVDLADAEKRRESQIMCTLNVKVEIENEAKPAATAEWLVLQLT